MSIEAPQPAGLSAPRSKEDLLREALELEDGAHRASDRLQGVGLLLRAAELRQSGLGDAEGARTLLRRAVQLVPEHRQALNRYTQLCVSEERWEELAQVLDLSAKAAKDDEERARVLAHRGDVLGRKLGRLAEARSMYREVARLALDPGLKSAAEQAVRQLEQLLLSQSKKGGRERTFVGRVKGLSEPAPPPPGPTQPPTPASERAFALVQEAIEALNAGRMGEARQLVEQSLALRPWNSAGLSARRSILRKEGRLEDLLRLLVAESEEAPEPKIAQAALLEAVEVAAESLADLDGALVLSRRLLMQFGIDDDTLARVASLAAEHGRLEIGKRLLPELSAEARAARFVALAATREAVGDQRGATMLYAVAFDDRPEDLRLFEARVQALASQADSTLLEASLRRRLSVTPDPDERRALAWELASRAEASGRLRDGATALVTFISGAGRDGDVSEALQVVDRLAGQLSDRALLVRAHEASVQSPGLSDEELGRRWASLGRFRRDELWDVEGAELAFVRAQALGQATAQELADLRRGITALGADSVPPQRPALLDDQTIEMDGPLSALVDLGPEPITEQRPIPRLVDPEPVPLSRPISVEQSLATDPERPVEAAPAAVAATDPEATVSEPMGPPPPSAAALVVLSDGEATQDLGPPPQAAPAPEVVEEPPALVEPPAVVEEPPAAPLTPFAATQAATLDLALAGVREAALEPPTDPASWLSLGRWALAEDRPLDAEACFDRGIDAAQAMGAKVALAAVLESSFGPSRPPSHRVLSFDGLRGAAFAARARGIAEGFSGQAVEEAWIEAAAEADPGAAPYTEALASLLEARGDRAGLSALLGRRGGFQDHKAEGRRGLRLAEVLADAGDLEGAGRAIGLALASLPLDIEPARRLVEIGLLALDLAQIAEGSRELRDRYLWQTELEPATAVSLVRAALDLDDADDQLLVALAQRRRGTVDRPSEDLASERHRLRRLIASRDVGALATALDPARASGLRLLLVFFSPSFLLSDLP